MGIKRIAAVLILTLMLSPSLLRAETVLVPMQELPTAPDINVLAEALVRCVALEGVIGTLLGDEDPVSESAKLARARFALGIYILANRDPAAGDIASKKVTATETDSKNMLAEVSTYVKTYSAFLKAGQRDGNISPEGFALIHGDQKVCKRLAAVNGMG